MPLGRYQSRSAAGHPASPAPSRGDGLNLGCVRLALVPLNQLMAGMVLAEDAVCLNGRVLLRRGSTLTEQHLKIFRTWGLADVDIVGADGTTVTAGVSDDADPELVKKERKAINERFRHVDTGNQMISALIRCALARAIETAKNASDR